MKISTFFSNIFIYIFQKFQKTLRNFGFQDIMVRDGMSGWVGEGGGGIWLHSHILATSWPLIFAVIFTFPSNFTYIFSPIPPPLTKIWQRTYICLNGNCPYEKFPGGICLGATARWHLSWWHMDMIKVKLFTYFTSRRDVPNYMHTEKSFRNLIKSNWNQIVLTIFRLICSQTDVRLVPNQSENGKFNLISVAEAVIAAAWFELDPIQ